MADGQTFSVALSSHRHFSPLGGLHRTTQLHADAEPAFATHLGALLTRNAMLKKALDQERAASADMRRILDSQKSGLPEIQNATTSVSANPTAEDLSYSPLIGQFRR